MREVLADSTTVATDSTVVAVDSIDSTIVDSSKVSPTKDTTEVMETPSAAPDSSALTQEEPQMPSEGISSDSTAQPIDSTQMEESKPQHITPQEAVNIRRVIDSLRTKSDSVGQVESYVRKTLPPVEVPIDSAELLRQDSIHRADSVHRVDSLRVFNPKAYKTILKRQKERLKARQKAERDSIRNEKARIREERYIAKLKKRGVWTAPDSVVVDSLDSLAVAPADSVVVAIDTAQTAPKVDTIERVIRGFHNVRIYKSNVQAVADSMAAFSKDSTIVMYDSPIMWNGLNQITSTKTTFYTNGEAIDRGYFEGDPIMASQVDKDHFNQVAGKTMTAFFRNNNVYRNDVNSNAQALYWMQEEGSPDIIAYATLIAADITFLLADQMVTHINGYINSEWTIYPPEMIPSEVPTVLDWFKWQPERKPERNNVFDRVILPSERKEYESMEKPRFPISRRINSKREHLQKYYHWVDRNDVLTDQTLEWVNAVKREYGHE
jgi:hypothetical protein